MLNQGEDFRSEIFDSFLEVPADMKIPDRSRIISGFYPRYIGHFISLIYTKLFPVNTRLVAVPFRSVNKI